MDYSYFGRNQKSRATRRTKSNLDTFSSQALWLNDLSMAEMQHHFEGPENFLRWHEDSHFPLSVSLYWSRSLYRNVSFAVGYERRKTCVCVLPVGFVPTKNGQSCKTQILAILQNWTFPFGAVAVWAQKRISAGLRSVKEIASGLWWALAHWQMTDVLLAGPVFFVNYIKGSFVCRTSSKCKGLHWIDENGIQ